MTTIRRHQNSVKTWLALIIIIAVFCLILPGTADAAIEFDAVSYDASGSSGTTLSWSHTIESQNNRILVTTWCLAALKYGEEK